MSRNFSERQGGASEDWISQACFQSQPFEALGVPNAASDVETLRQDA